MKVADEPLLKSAGQRVRELQGSRPAFEAVANLRRLLAPRRRPSAARWGPVLAGGYNRRETVVQKSDSPRATVLVVRPIMLSRAIDWSAR